MSGLTKLGGVIYKELLIELRDASRTVGLLTYSAVLLLVFAVSMPGVHVLPDVASGAIWLGLLLASTRAFDQSMRVELENGALEGMVLWPVHPMLIFYGKAIANAVILMMVSVPITLLVVVLYHPTLRGSPLDLAIVLALGAAGLAAPGTLVAAMTAQARGPAALLPMMLFSFVAGTVIAASRATLLIFEGDPMGQVPAWVTVLLVVDFAQWALYAWLFPFVVDEA